MIRIIFAAIVFFHGLIHLMGFLKAWNFSIAQNFNVRAMITLSDTESRGVGLLWLMCAISLLASLIIFLLEKPWWWIAGAVTVIISQLLVMLYWQDARHGTWINLIILIAVVLSYHQMKFNNRVKIEIDALINDQSKEDTSIITMESIKDLPPIVQKWLVRSNVIGTEKVHTVHLNQKGLLRSKPQGRWMPMKAEQVITADSPGFLWAAAIDVGFFMTINGRDQFKNGQGNMLIKAMNTITIANSKGKEIDQGSTMRFLAELMWLPSAALNGYLRWEYANDTTARAIMKTGDATVSGLFFFDDNGDVTGFEGKRYADFNDRYTLETWSVAVKEYKDFNGVRIANKCEVTWKLKTGNFTWLQLEVTDLEYNVRTAAEKVQVLPVVFKNFNHHNGQLCFTSKQ